MGIDFSFKKWVSKVCVHRENLAVSNRILQVPRLCCVQGKHFFHALCCPLASWQQVAPKFIFQLPLPWQHEKDCGYVVKLIGKFLTLSSASAISFLRTQIFAQQTGVSAQNSLSLSLHVSHRHYCKHCWKWLQELVAGCLSEIRRHKWSLEACLLLTTL